MQRIESLIERDYLERDKADRSDAHAARFVAGVVLTPLFLLCFVCRALACVVCCCIVSRRLFHYLA